MKNALTQQLEQSGYQAEEVGTQDVNAQFADTLQRWTPDQVRSIPWADPLPLIHQSEARPYPIDALPGRIGAAVREVADFAQCPISLAACSALSALSLAGQGLANVRRSEGLTGPVSLYFLAIAESGERKTTCDERFMLSIRKWEEQQAEQAKPDVARYEAERRAWEAKGEGILNAIKQGAKNDKPTAKQEAELRQLEFQKPQPPRVPELLLDDNTPEAIAWKLADKWPSRGSISSEAGVVFGGLGMGRDSIMRNLALLNKLWDGGTHKVDRRTTESFIVRGARLTIGLAVQPITVREFFESSKGLARGTGFAARFLIASEKSTQGYRPFKEAPKNWPCLLSFHTRIIGLLDGTPSPNERGELEPCMIDLSREAKAAWVSFHDEIEHELRTGGDMADIKDVASKAADNAARLAALFHLFDVGPSGLISIEHMQRAERIVAWHLYEARRFLGEIVLPKALSNAAKLDTWLRDYCRDHQTSSVATREVQRNGPYALRDKRALDDATKELSESQHVRMGMDGRQKLIYVNPALLSDGHGA